MAPAKNEFVPAMVAIPAGAFLMGAEDGMDNEKPPHRVHVDGFAIGKFPVTKREYKTYLAAANAAPPPFWSDSMFADPEKPVVGVSWHEAAAYCAWLAAESGLGFRLPTEAEWERAARGGFEGRRYPWGDELPDESACSGIDTLNGGPPRAGIYRPNGFGLYDMCASVHEWCSDFYAPDYYRISPERNPAGPPSGARKSSRGGSWRHRVKFSRCSARSSLNPAFQYADYGFRVARDG
ncbi:MAG TPA: SUMF1/EgtB/PvdO family nonheme iron enzyme [Candidatus Binatia bacterium]|jgi:formylglycine-generating enzyme required for sulfatase activity